MIKQLLRGVLPLFGLLLALPASAASLQVIPDKYIVKVGENFSTSILVDSEGSGINAVQAAVQFPAALVEVVRIENSGSAFSYWLEGPGFSNAAGTVFFTGGASNGISGKSLQAVTITFKVKGSGSIPLVFTEGAVTASDGSGTNVLSTMKGVTIESILSNEVAPGTRPVTALPPPTQITRPPVIAEKTPVKPAIEIPLYPDSKAWYNAKENFLVSWKLPPDVSAVATVVNQEPLFTPRVSEGLFDNKLFKAPQDGTWYVHVRFKNNVGWGETMHHKISIDTVPPSSFSIDVVEGVTTDTPTPTIRFQSGDTISGVGQYEIQDGDALPVIVTSSTHTFAPLEPGIHAIRVRAMDRAGNTTESSIALEIKPIPAPVIIDWSDTAYIGEGGLMIHGSSATNTKIELIVHSSTGEQMGSIVVSPDMDGVWRTVFDHPLKAGIYFITVRARDGRGALSLPEQTGKIYVGVRPALSIFGINASSTTVLFAISVLLVCAFIVGEYFARRQQKRQQWHSLLARRDITSFLQHLDQDLEKTIGKLEEYPLSERAMLESRRHLLDMRDRVGKVGKYLLEGIEDITKAGKKTKF